MPDSIARRIRPDARLRLAAALCLMLLPACGDGPTDVDPPEADVATLTVERSAVDLWVGATVAIGPTARDGSGTVVSATLTWSSSDPAVADVSTAGVVTATGPGSAVVTVRAPSGVEATASVTSRGLGDPMGGVLNQDYYLTNYFDQGTGTDVQDYVCGPKSYDGHLGLDLVLPDFRRMDEGIDVVAAADGRVVQVHDGEFDRNKEWGGDPWNVVVLDHGGQLTTIYGHLKNGSVAVAVGDELAAGAKLGEVGSSGRSDMPHLHLELVQGGRSVDPFGGSCSEGRQYFVDPVDYQDEFHLIGSEVTNEVLSLDRIKDGLLPTDTIHTDDDRVSIWVHLHNKAPGAQLRFELVRPDATPHGSVDVTRPEFYSMSWWWGWWDRTGLAAWPGEWTANVWYEGALLTSRTFHLDGLVTAPALAPAGEAASGVGGGAVRGDAGGR